MPTDLSDIQAAQSVKVIGSDSTGLEGIPVNSTSNGALHTNLRNNAGTEIGTSAAPVRVDPTGTTPQPATQSGAWTTGRTWTLASGSDSVAAIQSGTWNITNITGTISLPTGAATEATLATMLTLTGFQARINTLGQKTSALSTPVVLSSDQPAIPVTQSGAWTTARTWTLASGTDSVAAIQSGTWNITNITGTISLPTGAATEATLATRLADATFTGRINTLGQKTSAASTPVVLSSDQPAIPVTQSGTWTTGRTWALTSGADSVSAIQSGTWTTGRTWTLASGTDSVAAIQSGVWNITNITGTVSLPTGASTAANQATEITSLQLIDDMIHSMNGAFNKAAAIGGQLDDTSTTAATEDNVAPVRITPQRALHVNLRNQAGTELGTTTNPVQISDLSDGGGVQGVIAVSTTAVAVRVGVSNLANRKRLLFINTGAVNVYWGFSNAVTTSNGMILYRNQSVSDSFGPNTTIWVIAASAGGISVAESA